MERFSEPKRVDSFYIFNRIAQWSFKYGKFWLTYINNWKKESMTYFKKVRNWTYALAGAGKATGIGPNRRIALSEGVRAISRAGFHQTTNKQLLTCNTTIQILNLQRKLLISSNL